MDAKVIGRDTPVAIQAIGMVIADIRTLLETVFVYSLINKKKVIAIRKGIGARIKKAPADVLTPFPEPFLNNGIKSCPSTANTAVHKEMPSVTILLLLLLKSFIAITTGMIPFKASNIITV